jgi:hypothetical protein
MDYWNKLDKRDFSDVAKYLSQYTSEQDTVIMLNDPAFGATVIQFYWHGQGAVLYDARDPRLPTHNEMGDLYWVIDSPDLQSKQLLARLAAYQQWPEVVQIGQILIIREEWANVTMRESMERMVERLEEIAPNYQPVRTLRGCLYQAQGNIEMAAAEYQHAGTYFPLGDEYLRTAKGFAARGEPETAWREALGAKLMEPHKPEIHRWLSEKLHEEGYTTESQIEHQIADVLARQQVQGSQEDPWISGN